MISLFLELTLVIGEPGQDDIGSHSITLSITDGIVSAEQRYIIPVFKATDKSQAEAIIYIEVDRHTDNEMLDDLMRTLVIDPFLKVLFRV